MFTSNPSKVHGNDHRAFRWKRVLKVVSALLYLGFNAWLGSIHHREISNWAFSPVGNLPDDFVSTTKTDRVILLEEENSQMRRRTLFAYGYAVSGCTATSCIGYVLNVVTASVALKHANSTADIVLQVKMSSYINDTALDPEQELWLAKAGVIVKYTAKTLHDNFGLSTLEKYRVLEWTEYDRVLFLDADILPLCNMDYLFVESYNDNGMLQGTVGLEGGIAPITASLFLITPQKGDFDSILDLVRRHRERKQNATLFDPKIGWGHEMKSNDEWISWREKGNQWNFYAVSADQGLQYHWMRYMKLNYTLLRRGSVSTWQEVTSNVDYWENKTNVIEVPDNKFIAAVDERRGALPSCGGPVHQRRGYYARFSPYSDFYHFSGWQKPWRQNINVGNIPTGNLNNAFTGPEVWLWWLGQANKTLGLGFPSVIVTEQGGRNGQPHGEKSTDADLLASHIELPQATN